MVNPSTGRPTMRGFLSSLVVELWWLWAPELRILVSYDDRPHLSTFYTWPIWIWKDWIRLFQKTRIFPTFLAHQKSYLKCNYMFLQFRFYPNSLLFNWPGPARNSDFRLWTQKKGIILFWDPTDYVTIVRDIVKLFLTSTTTLSFSKSTFLCWKGKIFQSWLL